MGLDNSVIVLFIIMGCGVSIVMGWAISHRFMAQTEEPQLHPDAATQQAQYMREVRLRHHDVLAVGMGGRRALVRLRPEYLVHPGERR